MLTRHHTLYTAATSKQLDQIAIQQYEQTDLMARAGLAVFEAIQNRFPTAKRLLIFAGPGNNGGDAYVVAQLAYEAGYQVCIIAAAPPSPKAIAAVNAEKQAAATGVTIVNWGENHDPFEPDLIVDGLLGTGLTGPVKAPYDEIIAHINSLAENSAVIAIDIPSGLCANTGNVLGEATQADCTVTFIGRKQGLYTCDAPDYCGHILFNDLSIPSAVYDHVPTSTFLINHRALPPLPKRKHNSHKGCFGHCLIVGSDRGMPGASILAGIAALRLGAGRVSIATHPDHAAHIPLSWPDLMAYPVNTAADLKPLLQKADVVILGPGMTDQPWSNKLIQAALTFAGPMVLDAGALLALARKPARRDNWVLTPHPGEAAKLLACQTADIGSDRFGMVDQLAQAFGGAIVLKGTGTIIAHQESRWVSPLGTPALATAGSGDVLSGMIGACLAQGQTIQNAALLSVSLHGLAAGAYCEHSSERTMLASDLCHYFSHAITLLSD